MRNNLPALDFGLGLRTEHYNAILDTKPDIDWFEALSENYMIPGGLPLNFLDRIRADYPVVMHGVSLSVGSTTPFDQAYLKELKNLPIEFNLRGFPITYAGRVYMVKTCTTFCRCPTPKKLPST